MTVTKIKEIMPLRNVKTFLFASLIAAMILPFSAVGIADAKEDEDVKTNEEMIIQDAYDDLKDAHDEINTKLRTIDSEKELREFKSEYFDDLDELNDLVYIEPKRDYLAEWTYLDSIVMFLEDKQAESYSENVQAIIDDLYIQMDTIEQASIESIVLESAVEKKLVALEERLYNKYSNSTHETYIGENAVNFSYIDSEQQKVILLIDETKALEEKDAFSVSIAHDVLKEHGLDTVTVDFVEITEVRCNSTKSNCDPLIGGISLARDDGTKDKLAGSVGFRVKDSSNNIGFVTAGHVVQFKSSTNTKMLQPVQGSVVGTIPNNDDDVCYTDGGVEKGERTSKGQKCDFAFVTMKNGVSINDDIYKSSRSTYDINAMAVKSDQKKGSMLKSVGAKTGVVITGKITDPNANDGRIGLVETISKQQTLTL